MGDHVLARLRSAATPITTAGAGGGVAGRAVLTVLP